jgi:hypothetical protein
MIIRRLTMASAVLGLTAAPQRRRRPSYHLDPATGKPIRPGEPGPPPEAYEFARAHYADRHPAEAAPAAG